ncbi:hypothetical protein ACEPAG_2118 [Sanghuangporus baumii]
MVASQGETAACTEERRPLDGYQGFIEPRQLTLDYQNRDDGQSRSREYSIRQETDVDITDIQDPLGGPYTDLENTRYLSPDPFPDAFELNVRGNSRSPFLWSGDYGPNMMDPCAGFSPLPLDDWGARVDEQPIPGYDAPTLPSLGLPGPFPGVDEMLGHPPGLSIPGPTLPPLNSFAPLSPFPYETGAMDMLQSHHRGLHIGQPELDGGTHLPLLPALGNYFHDYEEQRAFQDPPPPADTSAKKTRVDKRNTRPLTVEDLLHDNSRFAKVVKAFLSIEDQENRTVPEIAKRVSEMYAGQYADFEGVKRMVNDVLQKHKAFWHPGRGSPYQLNLNEGRARREFPSNSRRLVRNRYDENLFYSRSKRQKKPKQPVKKSQDPVVVENHDTALFQTSLFQRDGGVLGQTGGGAETIDRVELGVIDPSLLDNYSSPKDTRELDEPSSPGRPKVAESMTTGQPGA